MFMNVTVEKKESALKYAKPLDVKWDKEKGKAIARFISRMTDGSERYIDGKMMYK